MLVFFIDIFINDKCLFAVLKINSMKLLPALHFKERVLKLLSFFLIGQFKNSMISIVITAGILSFSKPNFFFEKVSQNGI